MLRHASALCVLNIGGSVSWIMKLASNYCFNILDLLVSEQPGTDGIYCALMYNL